MKGFAVVMSLLLVFLLTFGAFSMLVFSMHHYSSTRNLIENENARNACYAAAFDIIHRFNFDHDVPWKDGNIPPWNWNGYRISGKLASPWSSLTTNIVTLSAAKGTFAAQYQLQIRQRRLEDFALFSDVAQQVPTAALFDGTVFVRPTLELLEPIVRFRDLVDANVHPQTYASFRRTSLEKLDYPHLLDFLRSDLFQNGIIISGQNPLFWNGESYVLALDELQMESIPEGWRVLYRQKEIGNVASLHLWFDDNVRIQQRARPFSFLPSGKTVAPVYVGSEASITLDSNLAPAESGAAFHPLCFIAGKAFRISSRVPLQSRFNACLIALGFEMTENQEAGLLIEAGGIPLNSGDKKEFLNEIGTSAFLVEPEKKAALAAALDSDEKIIWFRGSLILRSAITTSADLKQIHFEASRTLYSSLPSFPYIYIVEGSRRWP